jgi:hypothetical protein
MASEIGRVDIAPKSFIFSLRQIGVNLELRSINLHTLEYSSKIQGGQANRVRLSFTLPIALLFAKFKIRFSPIGDRSLSQTCCRLSLLRKGVDNFLIQFGFECGGIHSTLRNEQIDPVFDAIESGLKDLYHVRLNTYDKSDAEMLKYNDSENFIS